MLHPETVVADLALTMLLGLTGAVGAWLLRRRTTLSARNLYPLAAAGALMLAGAIGLSAWNATLVLLPLASPWVAGAIVGRMAIERPRGRRGASQPRARTAVDLAARA
jgi:site-specific recombinase